MDQRVLSRPSSCSIFASAPRAPSRPCRRLLCNAVLNLDPPKPQQLHQQQQRDVCTKAALADVLPLVLAAPAAAAAADAGAVPLLTPEQQPGRSLLAAVLDAGVLAPVRWYQACLASRPLATKAATAAVGFVLGDLVAQHLAHPEATDLLRAARLGAYGLLVDGPAGSLWYEVLEAAVFPAQPASTQAVLAKTALDQLVYATIMTGVYFALIKTMEGHPEAIAATIQAKFVPTLAANYMIWPLAHLINFRFVKAEYRILYNNVVSIGWLAFLSLMTHSRLDLMGMLAHLVGGGSSSH